MKSKYKVFAQYYFDTEDPEDCRKGGWKFMGETFAASEAGAINNVRFRVMGKKSQYKPLAVSGHWENGLKWSAVKQEAEHE